jgi:uncharacterized membrane protein YgcG
MEWPTTTQQATLRALQHVQRREAVSVTKNARRARESALVGTACLVAAKPTIANHVRQRRHATIAHSMVVVYRGRFGVFSRSNGASEDVAPPGRGERGVGRQAGGRLGGGGVGQ